MCHHHYPCSLLPYIAFPFQDQNTFTKAIHTMRLALQMWCLMRPPPMMIMPVFAAFIAIVFRRRRSGIKKVINHFSEVEIEIRKKTELQFRKFLVKVSSLNLALGRKKSISKRQHANKPTTT